MKVNDIISIPVATLTLDADVGRARDLMHLKKINAIPIVEVKSGEINVKGIVSYHDVAGVYDDTVKLTQVMTKNIIAIKPETALSKAAALMIENNIHHLLVMENAELMGIISSMDFVRLVAEEKA